MQKDKNTTWYQMIADSILQAKTFDLAEDERGYPTIHYLIAAHMLKDLVEYDRYRLMKHYVRKVKNNLSVAIYFIEKNWKTPVYSCTAGPAKKRLEILTIDKQYQNAYEKNYDRIEESMNKKIKTSINRVKTSAPRRLNRIMNQGQKMIEEVKIHESA